MLPSGDAIIVAYGYYDDWFRIGQDQIYHVDLELLDEGGGCARGSPSLPLATLASTTTPARSSDDLGWVQLGPAQNGGHALRRFSLDVDQARSSSISVGASSRLGLRVTIGAVGDGSCGCLSRRCSANDPR